MLEAKGFEELRVELKGDQPVALVKGIYIFRGEEETFLAPLACYFSS